MLIDKELLPLNFVAVLSTPSHIIIQESSASSNLSKSK
jgi:hypothetical protein